MGFNPEGPISEVNGQKIYRIQNLNVDYNDESALCKSGELSCCLSALMPMEAACKRHACRYTSLWVEEAKYLELKLLGEV